MAGEDRLLRAIALAQQGRWYEAGQLKDLLFSSIGESLKCLPCGKEVESWIKGWLKKIDQENRRLEFARKKLLKKRSSLPSREKTRASPPPAPPPPVQPADGLDAKYPPLIRPDATIAVSFNLPSASSLLAAPASGAEAWTDFRLRSDLTRLGLLKGFDELLCLPHLRNVDTYGYQVETVRKVLKQFRGRVVLADEVGLGKTIEAGMVLKEYMLRGMVERVLILTPATLVGQWIEEMESKFALSFASTYDSLARSDPEAFWAQPRVIASIATARRQEHAEILFRQSHDVVVVDEAHHLRKRESSNWKLVNGLQKRFLLLLSATPVQNSLVELYNLLTLLKPGIFKTEKEFRSSYMTRGQPRLPANQERLRELMRDVMIRNTRALVEVRLPPRHAVTLKLEPAPEEGACYQELSQRVEELHRLNGMEHRLALRHLLSAAGSSPAAAAAALHRFASSKDGDGPWLALHQRYQMIEKGAKEEALLELLGRNPTEKKMIFVQHRETLERLARLLEAEGREHARFDGSMSGPDKDRAIENFRDQAPVLLCTQSGGEGRNLQFCNTLINFDLPWNPMAIEQRIGRLHRIGQTREVFVFNLAVRRTVEESILKVLDEKINMFELVVGEMDAILGEMDEGEEFAELVFKAWVETTAEERPAAFERLGDRILEAKRQYEEVKVIDEALFGNDFEAV